MEKTVSDAKLADILIELIKENNPNLSDEDIEFYVDAYGASNER